jgi:hypothetical protein
LPEKLENYDSEYADVPDIESWSASNFNPFPPSIWSS